MNLQNFIQTITDKIGNTNILTDPTSILTYSYDNSAFQSLPSAVIFATEISQVQAVVKLCRQFHIPITARGAATSTTGAATPIQEGIVLSFERMNHLIKMDAANRVMVVETGITNQAVQDIAKESGFFWPPDPGSASTCTIGGNLACNAAGPHAVKYGATRDNVLGLKVITGEGELIQTGFYTTKSACGYDFTRLFIGSEGTLGIIAEATLKLTPLPEAKTILLAHYDSMTTACLAVSQIMAQPITPSALEFMDEKAIELLNQQKKFHFPAKSKALLLIEVDGPAYVLKKHCEGISKAAKLPGLIELTIGEDPQTATELWKARKELSLALKTIKRKKINEDVVVPVSNIPDFIQRVQQLSEQYQIMIINFGHAGNGNIHVNLFIQPENPHELIKAEACLQQIFDCVFALNGTLSGEHGIGLSKKPFIEKALGHAYLRLMQKVKKQFDPDNILNPGKIFDMGEEL